MTEKYQGIIIALSEEEKHADVVYYAPSQRPEYARDIKNGTMPDGRKILRSHWFDEPVGREGIVREETHLMIREGRVPRSWTDTE